MVIWSLKLLKKLEVIFRGKFLQKIYSEISETTPRFSTWEIEGKLKFLDLINPKVSFERGIKLTLDYFK